MLDSVAYVAFHLLRKECVEIASREREIIDTQASDL